MRALYNCSEKRTAMITNMLINTTTALIGCDDDSKGGKGKAIITKQAPDTKKTKFNPERMCRCLKAMKER